MNIAKESNISISGSEVIGLIPKKCLTQTAQYFNNSNKVEDAIEILGLNTIYPFNASIKILDDYFNPTISQKPFITRS
jgi:hypothetical protein